MLRRWSVLSVGLLLLLFLIPLGCNEIVDTGDEGGGGGGDGGGDNGQPAENLVVFNPVGSAIDDNLIDLEFLPGQNGESIVITQDGTVYYLRNNFSPLAQTASINATFTGDERGLLNVEADPLYGSNHYIYFYYTVAGSSPDINRVERRTVTVNTANGTFSLSDAQTILEFPKTDVCSNHNGGSLVFMNQDDLAIGVGDGGCDSSLGQNLGTPLGKIHRVIPNRTLGVGGFTDPGNGVSGFFPSIYSLGVRNPFTLVIDEDGDLFMGDVGSNEFEEINCVYFAGENFGWPLCEGPCDPPNPNFRDPIHGYSHGHDTGGVMFDAEDPADNPDIGESIMVNSFYTGTQYEGVFTGKLIYSEFYHGWLRLLTLDQNEQVTGDRHLGHLEGLISLHQNPADGFLYGVSLFGLDNVQRDHVLRMELAP